MTTAELVFKGALEGVAGVVLLVMLYVWRRARVRRLERGILRSLAGSDGKTATEICLDLGRRLGTLYPTLERMFRDGRLERETRLWRSGDRVFRRKFYRLTNKEG